LVFVFCSPSPNCEAEVYAPLAFRALISAALDGVNAFGLDGVSKVKKIYATWARRYQKIHRLADSPFPIPQHKPVAIQIAGVWHVLF
jgi:hypothetical protein